jgi:hypothetical protein
MPLLAPKDLSPEDRMIYRRWVGGLFATYGALLMIFCSFLFYQTVISPRQPQASGESADARPIDTVGSLSIRQAVKHD